ncbi:VCBS domain-containing protein, partial [Shewanella colwelliana]
KTGESVTDTVLVHSVDGTEQKITVTINGTDDKAVIAGTSTASLTEDKDVHGGQLRVDGALTVTDADSGQAQFQATSLQGQFGTLSINELGHWTYTADNSQTAIQGLKTGESVTDTLIVHSVDGTEQKITVTINGTDDKAVIAGTSTAQLTEDKDVHQGQLRVDGTLTVTDVDNGQNQFQATSLQGQFGTLSINELGHWTYTADNSKTAIQGLKTGESVTDTVLIHSVDGAEQKITVTINGTDDKAVIGGTSTAQLTEDKDVHGGQLRVDGALTVTDADNGQAQFQATSLQGQFGTLSINELGHWTYTADNSQPTIQGLKTGESVTDTVLVHSVDGTEQKITVTINGTDDKAVIAGTSTASVTEDRDLYQGQLRVDGALTVTDADSGQAQFQATSLQGQFGTLSINELGHWTYTTDNAQAAIQGLKTGESLTDTVMVHSVDGTSQQVTVTINGTDDKAVIAGTSSASLTEDKDVHGGQLRVDGALTVTDVDSGEAQFQATSLQGQFGTLSIDSNGHWTYTTDNAQAAIQGLKTGESLTDALLVHSVDGTSQQVTVTINGTDDKAVIGGTSTGTVTEDKDLYQGQLRVNGALTVTDVDSGEAQFQATSLQGQFGTLSINNLGHWTYTADNSQPSIQGLKTGESVTDTVLVHSVDGTEQKITVTINGTDDKAVIAGTSSASLTEDKDVHGGQLRVDGTLTVTDVDNNQAQFNAESLQGQFGTLSINNLGHWTYTADNSQTAIQGLKTGESVTDTVLVHSVDGTEQKITVTINGTDDKAVIGGTSTAQLTEDKDVHGGQLRVDGALTVTDVDSGQNQFQATVQQGQFGTLSINSLGHWTYTADNSQQAIQGLKTGESLTDTLVVHSVDGTEQKISVTINGTDDKAVIGGTSTASLTEDKDVHQGQLHVDGALTVTDVDSGQNQFQATVQQGQFGTLSINSLGHWTYTADNSQQAIQGLKTGESLTDTLVVHSVDGTEQKISVTINGTDDKAVITGVSTGDVDEGHGSFGDMSPDYAQPGMAKLGQAALTADGKLDIVDPDTGESQFDPKGGAWNNSYHGQYGHLLLNSDGTWHYDVTVGSVDWVGNRKTTIGSTIDKLGEGQTLTDTITIQSKDGTTHDIVITIHGSNDRPYCSSEVVIANGSEDTRQTLTTAQLLANTVDVDKNDAGKLTIENLHADHGSILINGDGTFTFTPEKDYNGDVHFSYDVKDAHGGVTHTGASTTLSAVGDAAQIAGVDTGSITENSAGVDMSPDYAHSGIATLGNKPLYADGKLTITDPDVGEAGFERQGSNGYDYHGTYGDLILLTDGTWHYHADAGHLSGIGARPTTRGTAIDQLGEGQSLTDTITVHSKDGTTHDIVITIHGSNDRPYCSSEVVLANGSEDTRQTLTTPQLLANTVDVDKNDAGKLAIENLHADHGSILINGDGTFTFTPEKDYNGDVHFSYDVKDAHGGVTHTGATTNLAAVNDNPDVTPLTDSVSEGADNHHTLNLLLGATDKEGDALTISHLEYAIDGQPQSSQLPTGITLDTDGHTLIVDATNPAFNHLANGQSQQIAITYQVEDGHGGSTQQTATLTIAGTDDKATLVSNVIQLTETQALDSEFKSYRGQLQLIDPDSGDNTQFVFSGKYLGQGFAPGHLDVWPNGTYQFKLDAGTNRHADDLIGSLHAGESKEFPYEVETSDGQKLTIMVKVTGEDNQAKIVVTPYSSLNNHVYEDHTSFGNTTHQLSSGGTLHVIDPDHDQAGFIAQTITTTEGGRFNINAQGHWSYNIDNDKVQHLGAGESFQQTFTVESIDGSAKKDITVTVHGTNDTPVASAEVRLANGLEDSKIVLTPALLLANTTDVDDNDIGKLSIENLQADHGSILINGDGTFTFTPEKDYNGDIHFSYDVKDAHGGITHTGASTTLAAVQDNAVIAGIDIGSVTEDLNPHASVQGNYAYKLETQGSLTVIDPDKDESGFDFKTLISAAMHPEWRPYSSSLGGQLEIDPKGNWNYYIDNRKPEIQHLGKGETLTDTVTVHSKDGTTHDIVITIHGTNDAPTVSSEVQLNSGKEDSVQTITAADLLAHATDIDNNDQGQLTVANLIANHGSIRDNQDGTFTFTPEKDYNGDVHFRYDVKDAHGGVTHTGASTTLSAVGDKAQIAGVDTGSITENSAGVDMSPDYAHSGIATLGNTTLYADGKLTITDPDVGESGFERQGSNGYDYHGTYGDLILLTDGTWHYHADAGHLSGIGARPTTRGTAIDQLGEGQSLTDTITVHSKDGTTHDIVITIHGSNDRPYCSSEVVLANGSEDTRQTLTTAQLLANTVDVDANDAGKLTIENLHADHGSILNNADGTFTFTPEKDYNGDVHFSYDVKDAHGGVTHTGATTSLSAVNDAPIVSPITVQVDEDVSGHTLDLLQGATDKEGDSLSISGIYYRVDGKPVSGMPPGISLGADGHTLEVDTSGQAYQHLAQGQTQEIKISYLVDDGHAGTTPQTASIQVVGQDDKATLASSSITMSESEALASIGQVFTGKLHLVDSDDGSSTQFQFGGIYLGSDYPPGNLDVWPDGSYQFQLEGISNRHMDDKVDSLHAGESMQVPYEVLTSDGQKLTIMVTINGEDDGARIEVAPYSTDIGNIHEDQASRSSNPNHLFTAGDLNVIDPDHDQAGVKAQDITTSHGGEFHISSNGKWNYQIDNNIIQNMAAGESFTEVLHVESIDGSAHRDVKVTVYGTNDAPIASAEVRLANGLEDSKIVLTPAQLLANTSDVDGNDIGKLSIENLQADHGSILIHGDGTFTFTPEKDYDGDVHFTYDVKDAHGGVTHTGASTTLATVNDAALINGQSQASSNVDIFEDGATSRLTGQLTLTDVDSGENQFATISQLAGQYGYLSMDQQGNWSYTLDNSLATTNGLVAGQVVTESFTLTSPDGTASHTINVQIHGHDDTPSLSVNEGGAVKSLDLLGGLSSGTVSQMQFSTDGVHYTNQVPDGFMLASDGHTLQVDPAHNSYNHLANGIALKVDIKYELQQGAGSNVQTSQQQAQVVVTGTSDRPIIHSFNPHSQQNNGPVTGNLLQGATDVDDGAQLVLHDVQFQDPVTHHYVTVQAGQTHNITGVGVIAISANGDYTFTPNSQFSGQVPNLIYRVTDTNGDYADSSQNNLTIHIDPYQAPIIIAPLAVSLAHDTGSSATDLITQDGALSISGQTAGMQVEYSTDGGAHWSSQFTPVEGLNQLQVRQTDNAGHTSKATSIDFTLDTNVAAPHISLDPITADDVLNQAELSGSVPVTGTVGSEVSVGDNITLTLGTHTYTGAVDAQHRFSIDIPANQLSSHTNISASVTITDTAGNNATATDNHHYSTDTNAAIRVNPITSDNIIEASEHQQAIDITGTVSGVEDGQTVTVTIAGQQYQAVVTQGAWHTSLTAAEVQALPGGTVDVTASVQDLAGNLASIHSPLFISDSANPVPTLSFKTPPTPTGSGSIGSHISGDLVAPPIIQQLTPSLSGAGWAITDGHGHTSNSLQGQYGTLTIDPVTGHVDYVYRQAPTAGNKATGGTHWAGQTTSEEHHDVFQVVYHDAHASNVDVKVNVDVTYVHGHSGHNQTSTHLVGMTITPDTSAAPPPAPVMHDAPQDDEFSAVIVDEVDLSSDVIAHQGDQDTAPSGDTDTGVDLSHAPGPIPAAPIDHYLQMVGLAHEEITSPSDSPVAAELPTVTTLASSNADADMLDTLAHDHFDNPLSDEDPHKGEHAVIIDDSMDNLDHQANDDDLLHNALNDMHNQT